MGDATRMTDNRINCHSRHGSGICFRSNTVILLAVLVAIGLATRLLFMGTQMEGWDSIDFALGLHDYDIVRYQPHFPGYPVYMSFCRLVHLFTDNDVLALTIPGAVLGGATLIPLFYLAKGLFSEQVALLTAFVYVVNPLCWLQSEKALSDAVGLFFIVLSAQLLFYAGTSGVNVLRYIVAGSMMLGICLGVRLSYFPFIILWFFVLRTLLKSNVEKKVILYGFVAFVIGIGIWLIPLACFTGVKPFITNGLRFTSGHFGDWGGSVATSQNVFSRFTDFVWCVFCNGLGFWCYDTSFFRVLPSAIMGIGLFVYVRNAGLDYNTRFIVCYMLPYFLWVFFGQNLEKPRHVIPLIPLIIICISAGLVRLRDYGCCFSAFNACCFYRVKTFLRGFSPYHLFIGILIISMSIISLRLVYLHKNETMAQMQLLDYVGRNYDVSSTRIYCWETKRFFDYYAPLWDARRARNIADLQYDLGASLAVPEVILSTAMVTGVDSPAHDSKLIVEFKNNRYMNNPYHKLTLYDVSSLK